MDSPASSAPEVERVAGPEKPPGELALWLDRLIVGWLFVFVIAAPHSIAATQAAWAAGLLFSVVRFFIRPRPRYFRSPLDYALLGFFILTGISAFFSYEPFVSIGKLRSASLFTIVYLFALNVRSRRVLRLLTLALVASCMVNVIYTITERIVGRGVKVEQVNAKSPLAAAVFVNDRNQRTPTPVESGDTLLEVDGRTLHRPEELAAALEANGATNAGPARIKIYRYEWMPTLEVPRASLLDGANALERLGVGSWKRGRDWRASGFYGHYVTYAEALQLIASLTFGLFIALKRKWSLSGWLLGAALAGLGLALMLTVTRASWLAFMLSAAVILLVGASRRTLFVIAACALPVVVAGLLVLQQKRNVGFVDQRDQSITWRETVWREGFHLLVSKPRHLLVGVGMDSIKAHWREWGLFDGGRIPVGHMHSTPLQFALERGLPALSVWIILVVVYARMLWRLARRECLGGWIERGIVLGALGGLVGFLTSGMVHYNFGDSEVVMIFYLMMGLSLVVEREAGSDLRLTAENAECPEEKKRIGNQGA